MIWTAPPLDKDSGFPPPKKPYVINGGMLYAHILCNAFFFNKYENKVAVKLKRTERYTTKKNVLRNMCTIPYIKS